MQGTKSQQRTPLRWWASYVSFAQSHTRDDSPHDQWDPTDPSVRGEGGGGCAKQQERRKSGCLDVVARLDVTAATMM